MTTGRKLAVGAIIIAAVTIYLAFAGAASSWQYYLTVDECVDQAPQFVGSQLPGPRQSRCRHITH